MKTETYVPSPNSHIKPRDRESRDCKGFEAERTATDGKRFEAERAERLEKLTLVTQRATES